MRIYQNRMARRKNRFFYFILGISLGLLAPEHVLAQATKIGIVRFDEILMQLPEYRGLMLQLDSIRNKADQDFKQIQQEVAQPLSKTDPTGHAWPGQPVAGSPTYERQQAFSLNVNNALQHIFNKQIKPIHDRIRNAIRLIALMDGYTYVLNYSQATAQVIRYLAPDHDLTESVKIQLGLQPGHMR